MRYSESKRAIFFVSTTAGASRWQYSSIASPGTGFQQPVGCSCGCPRKLMSVADYRGCTTQVTAVAVPVPATTTPTLSKAERGGTAVLDARAFSAEQTAISSLADTDAALDTYQWLTNNDIDGLRRPSESFSRSLSERNVDHLAWSSSPTEPDHLQQLIDSSTETTSLATMGSAKPEKVLKRKRRMLAFRLAQEQSQEVSGVGVVTSSMVATGADESAH